MKTRRFFITFATALAFASICAAVAPARPNILFIMSDDHTSQAVTDIGTRETRHSILARFDCDLSQDLHDPWMKQTDLYLKPEAYFSQGLGKQQRERIQKECQTSKSEK